MFKPALCIYEIFSVAEYKRKGDYPECDLGTAAAIFMADVKLGAAHAENTGDALPGFDFAAAKAAWDSMTDEEQSAALADAVSSRVDLRSELAKAYPDKDAMLKLVEDYLSAPAEAE